MTRRSAFIWFATIFGSCTLIGCTTNAIDISHGQVELTGKITGVTEVEKNDRRGTNERGGMLGVAGALGGIAGGIVLSMAGTEKYSFYDITSTSKPVRYVRVGFARGLVVGQCVEVLVTSSVPEKHVFLQSEGSLRVIEACSTER